MSDETNNQQEGRMSFEPGDYVVITTDINRRGVFGGRLLSQDGDRVTLEEARMCVYWSRETRGVLGLASHGPARGSRISRAIPKFETDGVVSLSLMTDEARKAWEDEPWD